MVWKEIARIRIDNKKQRILLSDTVKMMSQRHQDAANLLPTLAMLTVDELKDRIRARKGVPWKGYNKFGYMFQVIEVEKGKDLVDDLNHVVTLDEC